MNLLGIDTSSMDAKLHIQNFETVLLGVTVGTQGNNAPSLALYRGAGLAEARRQETLHWMNVDTAPAEGARAS